MSWLNDKDVPVPYLHEKRKDYQYGDLIECNNCPDGVAVWAKNGWVCTLCEEIYCEACCDDGFFDENDDFICERCMHEMKQESLMWLFDVEK